MLPGWADEVLDLIGVSWPNVDEDDYREMATAMREFAADINDGASQAHEAVQALVSSAGGGQAAEALNAHWSKINGTHLTKLAQCGELAATALDGVAVLIEGAKIGAIVQLGILAAEVIAAQAAAPFTLGLSEVGALGATQVTRVIVKRLFKEVCQQVAEQVVSIALTPVEEALGAMVGDLVVQLGANALGVKDGVDLGQTAKAGKEGFAQGVQGAKDAAKSAADNPMQLLSAGGGGGAGGGSGAGSGGFTFDHDAHDKAVTGLHSVGGHFRNTAGGKIGRAKSHHGRTRGKDAIADAANAMLDKVIDGIEDAVKKSAKHLDDNMTRGIKQMAKNHKENDEKLSSHFAGLGKGGNKKEPAAPGGSGASGSGAKRGRSASKTRDQLGKEHPNNSTRSDAAVKECGDPVDVATGRVFLTATDVVLPGVLPLTFVRRFESSYRVGRHMGPSWSSTVDQRLEVDDQGIVFVTENGLLLSYDAPAPRETVLPARGPRWPLTLTEQGDWAIHNPDSGHTRYFSAASHAPGLALLHEISDRNGNHITFDYDDRTGAPLTIDHSGGYHLKLTSDEHGRITALHLAGSSEEGPDVLVRSYGYDEQGNLASVVNSSGIPAQFEYDHEHRMTAWIDTNGSRYEYTYDSKSRCVSQRGIDGHLFYRYQYHRPDPLTGHRITAVMNSLGHTSHYRMNERLQVVAETDPMGNTTRREWDSWDHLLSYTDALGNVTRYVWDEAQNLTEIHLPDGSTQKIACNSLHLPVEVKGADGSVWRQEWDSNGNRTSATTPDGACSTFTFDATGAVASATDPTGATRHFYNNDAGLPIAVRDPLGHTTSVVRDAFGRVTQLIDPTGAIVRLEWTADGDPVRRILQDGRAESWTWDGEGNCLSHTDANGGLTRYEYTHFDELAARTGPDGVRYEFAYDTELRITSVRNPQGLTWDYMYDAAGRLASETDFDDRTITYQHDAVGRPVFRRDPLGQTITYTWDSLGQLVSKDAAGEVTRYSYNTAGEFTGAVSPTSTLTFERDAMGRVLRETVDGRTTTYSYDAEGRRIIRVTPTGVITHFAYDAAGNRTDLSVNGHRMAFEHDELGREVKRAFGGALDAVTLTTVWDERSRPTQQTLAAQAGPLRSRAYRYRPDSYVTDVIDQLKGTRTRLGLDPVGRPVSVTAENWSESYAYDSAGNQTTAEWPDRAGRSAARGGRTYSGTRLLSAGRIRYEYDAAGRTRQRQRTRLSRKPDTWRYDWDAEDRLVACSTPDGTVWNYTYDPLGRRTSKRRLAADGSIAEEVVFTWDGTRLAEQTAPDTGVTLTWDHDDHRPLTQTERRVRPDRSEVDSRFFAIITDLVGTPTELVDETGHVAWYCRRTLWGATARNSDATAHTPLRFPGQYEDQETALHYNFHRHYDPDTARYVTPDPLGLEPAPNPSAYPHNPHTWSDPLGLAPEDCKKNKRQRSDPEKVCTIGDYAQESIPAQSKSQKFTSEERQQINDLGRQFGCHSCGSKDPMSKGGNFVPDHQPISSWVPDGTPQRLYPQCLPCSRQQAGWARQLAPIMKPLYEKTWK
ncbi:MULTISPECIES: DUF6531 domain-containing protein [Streptomyces]|uniref:DUF6531 domain-containing protein n=1 Tax=Streptomyces TaxID=1883 RepID=UPI003B63FA5F